MSKVLTIKTSDKGERHSSEDNLNIVLPIDFDLDILSLSQVVLKEIERQKRMQQEKPHVYPDGSTYCDG